jgi:hypothetical protein
VARCAIYTRVSTDHGLEQDFNSLDAQHDAAQAYIRSQAHAGTTSPNNHLTWEVPPVAPTNFHFDLGIPVQLVYSAKNQSALGFRRE